MPNFVVVRSFYKEKRPELIARHSIIRSIEPVLDEHFHADQEPKFSETLKKVPKKYTKTPYRTRQTERELKHALSFLDNLRRLENFRRV